MSDASPPPPGEAAPDPRAELARLQQRALEQDLRIADLERTTAALVDERAALIEHQRVLRAHTGIEGAARELKTRLKQRVQAVRSEPEPVEAPAVPLASLPVTLHSAVPRWDPETTVLGDVRPALLADPPGAWSWDLVLPPGAAIRGAVALKPQAWDMNHGGVDLVVELLAPTAGADGASESWAPVTSFAMSVDPGARVADRGWLPWRMEFGAAAGRHRLVVRTRIPEGASPDYAWLVIGDPRLELPGLAPRAAAPVRAVSTTATADLPIIALLMPVHDPDIGLLDRTLASVTGQSTANWELCIVDDGSRDPIVRDRLVRAAAEDARVTLHRHEVAEGISGATNRALALAKALYVATLDHDDVLAPDAVESMARELHAHPGTDFVYSDNDLLAGDARRFAAALKPDWSPDLLRACMYTLHFAVYRRSVIEALGGWRSAFDGAQDHDLVLRLAEQTDRIRHLPRILYHWRAHAGSAALGELAKPEAYERGRRAIEEHLGRTGHVGATVERLPQAGRYRVRYPRTLPVAVVIAVPDAAAVADLAAAVHAFLAELRPSDTVLVALDDAHLPGAAADEARGVVASFGDDRVRLGAVDELRAPDGVLLSLTRPLAPSSPDAVDELAGLVEAGATRAGGVVTTREHRVVAGAVAFPRGLPVRLHAGSDLAAPDRHPTLTMVTNQSAVDGVVATRIGTGSAVGAAAADRVVWSPHAVFVASDAAADALLVTSLEALPGLDRGARPDPFWNPQLWPDRGDATVPESVHGNPLLDLPDA